MYVFFFFAVEVKELREGHTAQQQQADSTRCKDHTTVVGHRETVPKAKGGALPSKQTSTVCCVQGQPTKPSSLHGSIARLGRSWLDLIPFILSKYGHIVVIDFKILC